MPALNGVMAADFSDFFFEVDKSVVKLKELEGASAHTSGSIDAFGEGMSQADRILGLFGIRIGPQIQAVRELGAAAGKTASDIGLIGTAGLTVGAALAGWSVGRMVSDFFDLDEAIGNATASLLGFGDVAAERAGAKLDVLNRAAQIAGRTVLDFDEAMKIITEHNKAAAESFNTGAARVEQWNREIAAVRASGNLPAIQAELKNHTSTLAEISQHYGISTRALEYYTRTLSESAKVQKAWADEARPRYEAIAKAQEEVNQATGGWHKALLTIVPATAAAATEALNLGVSQQTVATAFQLTTSQVGALDRQMQLNLATMAATEPALGSLDEWIKTNYADTKAWNNEWRFTSEVIGEKVAPALEDVTSKIEGVSAAMSSMTAMVPGMTQKSPGASIPINLGEGLSIPNFDYAFDLYSKTHGGASGVGMIGGGPAPDFLSWAMSHGYTQQAPQVNNTFNIVDTESGIARRVGETITSQVQRGSLVN